MATTHTVLLNSPALNSLPRKQLTQLCKRYGQKASGKNVALIERLQAFAETLPKEAFDDPSFKIADFIAAAGRGGGSSFTPSSSVPRQSEAWEMLEAVEEGFEEGSWKSAESSKEGTAVEGEFGLWGTSSLSRSASKTLKSLLSSSSRNKKRAASPPPITSAMDVDLVIEPVQEVPPSPVAGVARPLRPSLSGETPTMRLISSGSESSQEMSSPPKMTARIPANIFQSPRISSTSSTHPKGALPSRPSIPGTFPSLANTSTSDPGAKPAVTPVIGSSSPFVFGGRQSLAATDFVTPTIAAAAAAAATASPAPAPVRDFKAEMDAELQRRMHEKGLAGVGAGGRIIGDLAPSGPWASPKAAGSGDGRKRRYDEVHEKEFSKMTSIMDHYSNRRPVAPTSTSTALASTHQRASRTSLAAAGAGGTPARRRPSTSVVHRPSLVGSSTPRYRSSLSIMREREDPAAGPPTEEAGQPAAKRTRVGFEGVLSSSVESAPVASAAPTPSMVKAEEEKKDEKKAAEEKAAFKRRQAVMKARRSSLAQAGGKRLSSQGVPVKAPKAASSHFGFLHTTIKRGVAALMGTSTSSIAQKQQPAIGVSSTASSSSVPKLSRSTRPAESDKKSMLLNSKKSAPVKVGSSASISVKAPPAPVISRPSALVSKAVSRPPTTALNVASRPYAAFGSSAPRPTSASSLKPAAASASSSTSRPPVTKPSSRPSSLYAPTASSLARQQANSHVKSQTVAAATPSASKMPVLVPLAEGAATPIQAPARPVAALRRSSGSSRVVPKARKAPTTPPLSAAVSSFPSLAGVNHDLASTSATAPNIYPPLPIFTSSSASSSRPPLSPSASMTLNAPSTTTKKRTSFAVPPPTSAFKPATAPAAPAAQPYRPQFKQRVARKLPGHRLSSHRPSAASSTPGRPDLKKRSTLTPGGAGRSAVLGGARKSMPGGSRRVSFASAGVKTTSSSKNRAGRKSEMPQGLRRAGAPMTPSRRRRISFD